MNLLSIGLSGLNASQTALTTTGNNITNVDTAGYTRQQSMQTTSASQFAGQYYIGTGTTVQDVRRLYSEFMNNQLRSSTAVNSDAQTYLTQVNQVDSLLSDSSTGLSSVMQNFFASLQTAAGSPTDVASRQLVLTQAGNLAQRFNSISTQLGTQNSYVNTQMESIAGQVTDLAKTIAQYNQAITAASASGANPNDLLDKRDQAVAQLSSMIGVSVVKQDSSYNLYLGSGQPLVVGSKSAALSAGPSATNPGQDSLTLTMGNASLDVTSVVTGGQMGGLLRYRNEVLQPTQNELGRMSIVLADTMNSQLAQGLDLNGNFGAGLFKDINDASVIGNRSLANTNNTGTGNLNVSIDKSSALTTSDYEVTFTSSTAYTVKRSSDGKVMGSGDLTDNPPAEFDGFSISQQSVGTIQAGDRFTLIPTRTASADISVAMTDANRLAFASPLVATTTTGNIGSGTISSTSLTTKLDASNASTMPAAIQSGLPVKLVFDAASAGTQSYTVYDSAGNSIGTGNIVPGQSNDLSVTVAGTPSFSFQTTIAGYPGQGDSFTVGFNANGDADNSNGQKLIDLQSAKTVGSGTGSGSGMSLTGAYSSLTETVGAQANQAQLDATATSAVLDQAQSNRDSLSAVNLDEEAANLVKFQQYYTASAQIIKTAQTLFDTLINNI
ncbi:flagellar hook-associated protein FlgK [Pseudomonas panipatensis]|uniref:Flagellar hook-associated protein 1 n=1 Tax=Pseudomonas panipatensis TaxID=428992 RepID=A0A1G8C2S4_9PSED|nr:flagellar hook-associated protein FlgK [Pseudomonas panipatensis]SDH39639.1 flagellar hook-associated protein 1 FlgK [Pseudomonas panipatensis]SMP66408.1 flagellar hook-associated protein 1 FlgK [Pseudomonas panipatensis]